MNYTYTWSNPEQTMLRREGDGQIIYIPTDPGNRFYKEYLESGENIFTQPYTPPPKTWDEIRVQRNELLSQSDWTQTPDSPLNQSTRLTERAKWREYRQALRDITTTYTDPNDVVFPDAPA